jgi:hypothetical protein
MILNVYDYVDVPVWNFKMLITSSINDLMMIDDI